MISHNQSQIKATLLLKHKLGIPKKCLFITILYTKYCQNTIGQNGDGKQDFVLSLTQKTCLYFLFTGKIVLSQTCQRVTYWYILAGWLTTTRAWQQPKARGTFSSPLSMQTTSTSVTNTAASSIVMVGRKFLDTNYGIWERNLTLMIMNNWLYGRTKEVFLWEKIISSKYWMLVVANYFLRFLNME